MCLLQHANDYWTEKTHNVSDTCPHDVYPMVGGGCFTDMWDGTGPAVGQNGTSPPNGSASHQSIGYPVTGPEEDYEEYKFKQRVLEIIGKHPVGAGNTSTPLFMCYCFHIVHEPLQVCETRPAFLRNVPPLNPVIYQDRLGTTVRKAQHRAFVPTPQVPEETYAAFSEIQDDYLAMGLHHRRIYHAMVSYMDSAVGDVVDLLQSTERRMWNDTLVVFQTDNGGPSFAGGLPTANNFPHKGTKSSNWVRTQEIKYYAACSE